ncbi:MAG: hypothetical protein QME79_02795 [Bacillota bacterium]|nr:hypothetical protein [Bacillota bacterium]
MEPDTIERVDQVFRKQRRLTFSYAAVFFFLVLLIPYLTINAEWWYGRPVWGGLTLNFLVVGIVFHLVYWLMGLFYTIQANRLEDELLNRPSHTLDSSKKGGALHA